MYISARPAKQTLLLRRLIAGLVLSAAAVAAPAQAQSASQPQPQTIFSGLAGSYTVLTLRQPLQFDERLSAVTANRGDFMGLAFVSASGDDWLTWITGRVSGAPCAFGPDCNTGDFAQTRGSDWTTGGYQLPAGTYRVALLGRPGALITVATTLPGRSGPVATSNSAHLQVSSPAAGSPTAGTPAAGFPALGADQPKANGSAAFANTGPTVVGAVVRIDTSYGYQVNLDFCFADVAARGTVLRGCTGPHLSNAASDQVGYVHCDPDLPGPFCAPLGSTADAVTVAESQVLTTGASAAYDVRTLAAHSRVAAVLYALWF